MLKETKQMIRGFLCANVNGGSMNMGDVSGLYAHIKGTGKRY